jgi:ribosomal protein S21
MIRVIEIKKTANESNMNLVRRFTRKVQESGIIQKVKSKRYNQRNESKLKTKIATLKKLARKKEQEKLFKLGKVNKFIKKRGHK